MANSLSAGIAAIIAAKGAPVLRKRAIMPRYVNTDWSNDVAAQGDTIQVQVSATKSVSDVSPGPVPPTPSDTTITQVPIVLSSWKKADFHLTSKQAHELMRQETYITQEMEEAFAAIANQVNSDLFSLYTKVYGYAGTAATTPFASDTTAATSVRKILNKQLAPPDNRSLILDPDAEALALNLPAFQYVQNAGDNSVIREGSLGRRLGFDIDSTTTVPTHTAGTISDGSGRTMKVNNSGGYAAGVSTLNFTNTTLTGTLAGQIVMEGFLNIRIRPWLRRLITRLIAIVPAAIVAIFYGESGTAQLLILSQVILSLQLSFAVFPLVMFTSDRVKMGAFVNSRGVRAAAWIVAVVIASLNAWLLVQTFTEWMA